MFIPIALYPIFRSVLFNASRLLSLASAQQDTATAGRGKDRRDRLDKTPADHLALTYHDRRNTMRYRDLVRVVVKLDQL